MSLAVMGKNILYFGVDFSTVFLACLFNDFDTAERFDGTAKHFIGLQTDNDLVFLVNVAGSE